MADGEAERMVVRCTCGVEVRVRRSLAGLRVECPSCRGTLKVPETVSANRDADTHPAAIGGSLGTPVAHLSGGRPAVTCQCGKSIRVPAGSAGKKVRCPACDRVFVVAAATGTVDGNEKWEIPLTDDEPEPTRSDAADSAGRAASQAATVENDVGREDSNLYELADEEEGPPGSGAGSQPAETTCVCCGGKISPATYSCVSCGYNVLTRRRPHKQEAETPEGKSLWPTASAEAGYFLLGLICCAVASLIGAAIWYGVAAATHYELGYVAWAVGGLAGAGMYLGARGQSVTGGVAAATMSVVAIILAKGAIYTYILGGSPVLFMSSQQKSDRAYVVRERAKELFHENPASDSAATRQNAWDRACREAGERIETYKKEEIEGRVGEYKEQAQQKVISRKRQLLANRHVERAICEEGVNPFGDRAGDLTEELRKRYQTMPVPEVDKALDSLLAWDELQRWNDAEYVIRYAAFNSTLEFFESTPPSGSDKRPQAKPSPNSRLTWVATKAWDDEYEQRLARVRAMPADERMVEAKRFAAKQMSASQWFKGAMEYDDAYGLTLSEANYSSSRSFMITMFEPMSCVFLVLAAVTAFGVATGLPMWGKE